MSRNKGFAPPPPARLKPGARLGGRAEAEPPAKRERPDSLVVLFDELTRNAKVLRESGEEQFLQFATCQEECRRRWQAAEGEVARVAEELQNCETEVHKLEMKLGQARDLLATETGLRKKAEQDRDALSFKWEMVRELISQPGDNNDETRLRLQKLEASMQHSMRGTALFSPGGGGALQLSPVHESSTCSILDASDLSFDATQGSVLGGPDESKLRSGRAFKRKSSGGGAALAAARQDKRGRGSRGKSLEAMAARRSVGTERYNERNIDAYLPSAPPAEEPVTPWRGATLTPSHPSAASVATLTPSLASTATLVADTPCTPANPVRRTHSNNRGLARPHQFVQKNNFKTETCGPCQRRIKFGKICYKCRECRAVAHPECRDQAPLPCVPSGSASKTPSKPGQGYRGGTSLADHTPPTAPMVPGLVVYCAQEVEARGLAEVGLYRVPGSEREVKELRDKFLAGRGCPPLGQVEVHVLCGVIKDFLRNLREPLVPASMWSVFTSAASNPDTTDGESELFQAVSELPQPNRDTMAFLMLHLQKVAGAKETKMSQSNLAKILGPTVIGYSSLEASPEEIMREVGVQAEAMEKLLAITSDYWATFLTSEGEELYRDSRFLSPATPETLQQASIFRTPGAELTPQQAASAARPAVRGRADSATARIFASPVLY